MKRIRILLLNILIITSCSYFIFKSERFQEKISPKKFWNSKVKTLKSELKKDYVKIKFLRLDLERENALLPYLREMAKIQAQELSVNFDEIFKEIKAEHLKKTSEIKRQIEDLTKEEEEIKSNLQIANNQIKIHQ